MLGVIVPIGKKRREYLENLKSGKPAGLKLPKKTSFVFTEDHAFKHIVARMMRDCPSLVQQEDKEAFLVKFLQTIEEVENDGFMLGV